MIGRALTLILAVSLLVGMVAKIGAPRVPPGSRRPEVQSARKCPNCDAYVLGADPAPCALSDCPFRRT